MKKLFGRGLLLLSAAVMAASLCFSADAQEEVSKSYIDTQYSNPISASVFCADPTAVEYNGRLYVYGTNDHQQLNETGKNKDNTYDRIKSLVVFSTDDMVNWVYHGEINVKDTARWIRNSWAPSVVSRVEEDGLTHFYLYFSNNGMGVGVITATDPLGPWSDPLGKPLVSFQTQGLKDCPNPFDPGVVIDDDGVGWLAFGGGIAENGTDFMPGSARIVRLGSDMLSFDSDFAEIPAPHFFEASELNFIGGSCVYTYCSDWKQHGTEWSYDTDVPGGCSMIYMKTKTPLDKDSWQMGGECLKNPGDCGLEYSNNHTHLHKYNDKWYMLYHTLALKNGMNIKGGYRSICCDETEVDEQNVIIKDIDCTKEGLESAACEVSPFDTHSGAAMCNCADITFDTSDAKAPAAVSGKAGAWTGFRYADFAQESKSSKLTFAAKIKGEGTVEVRLDSPDGETIATLTSSSDEYTDCESGEIAAEITGRHDLYFVFSNEGMAIGEWSFKKTPRFSPVLIAAIAGAAALAAVIAAVVIFRKKAARRPLDNTPSM